MSMVDARDTYKKIQTLVFRNYTADHGVLKNDTRLMKSLCCIQFECVFIMYCNSDLKKT